MTASTKELKILHLILSANELSAPYNEHCLPTVAGRNITVCTYFEPAVMPPAGLTLFAGDGSPRGFYQALAAALESQSYDVIHAHAVHFGLLLTAAKPRYGKALRPLVFTIHTSYQNFTLRNKLLLALAFAFSQRIVCCSRASLASFPAFYRRLAGGKLSSIQNGIDIDRVDRTLGDRHHDRCGNGFGFNVVTVGRLIEVKSPLSALRALRHLADPACRLAFIGEGPLRQRLLGESEASGLGGQVELTGLIPREQVYRRLLDADLFLSTSRLEGLPVAALEAMACRCPVILSDIAPHREIAAGADFIPLVRPDDAAGFAREIKRFQQMPRPARLRVGERCRDWAERRFSLTAMQQRYDAVYRALSQRPGRCRIG